VPCVVLIHFSKVKCQRLDSEGELGVRGEVDKTRDVVAVGECGEGRRDEVFRPKRRP